MTWILAIGGFLLSLFLSPRAQIDRYYQGWQHGAITGSIVFGALYLMEKLKMTFLDVLALALGAFLAFMIYAPKVQSIKPPEVAKQGRRHILPFRNEAPVQAGRFIESKDGVGPGGIEVMTDLPVQWRKANISAKGLGCCVFRSGDHCIHWAGLETLYGMPEWLKSKGYAGDGWPEKFDEILLAMCKDKGVPVPDYVQHTDGDPKFLEEALKNGYMLGVTYDGRDPRYGLNKRIAHMVNLVYLDDKYAMILDNNFIDSYLIMSREDFLSRWNGGQKGWALVFLSPPPPPVPHN